MSTSMAFVTLSAVPNKISERSPIGGFLTWVGKESCRLLVDQVLLDINQGTQLSFERNLLQSLKLFVRAGGSHPSVFPFFLAVQFLFE